MREENQPKLKLKFPKSFLWGAATSAHQVEGGNHNQWTVWELENAKVLATQAEYRIGDLPIWNEIKDDAKDPNNYISGIATDHYHRYTEDFDLVKKLNMNTFRFSIEWSRIEPSEGKWNVAEIAHYKKYIRELKKRGIEPMPTLFHWTVPVWFEARGAFARRGNIKYFVRFVEKIISELGMDVRYICILNEPETHVFNGFNHGGQPWPTQNQSKLKAVWTYNNLAVAHNRSAKAIKALNKRYKVGTTRVMGHFYAGDKTRLSHISALLMQWFSNYWFFNRIRKHIDWMGLNYYFSNRVIGYGIHNPEQPLNDLGWYMSPDELEQMLEDTYDKYKLPIIVTESGVADKNDEYRQWWLAHSLLAMQRAMSNGVDLKGYLHWSLMDNFEWAHGKWPRFGLIEVDYKTLKRTPRGSAIWFAKVIKRIQDN